MQDYKEGRVRRDTFILSGDSGSIITTLLDLVLLAPRLLTTKKERKKRKETAPL